MRNEFKKRKKVSNILETKDERNIVSKKNFFSYDTSYFYVI